MECDEKKATEKQIIPKINIGRVGEINVINAPHNIIINNRLNVFIEP